MSNYNNPDNSILSICFELNEIVYHISNHNANELDIDAIKNELEKIKLQLEYIKMGNELQLSKEEINQAYEMSFLKETRKK